MAAALSGTNLVPLCTSAEGADGRGLRLHSAGVDVLNGAKLAARKIALVGVLQAPKDAVDPEPERGLFLSANAVSVAEQDASMLLLVLREGHLEVGPEWARVGLGVVLGVVVRILAGVGQAVDLAAVFAVRVGLGRHLHGRVEADAARRVLLALLQAGAVLVPGLEVRRDDADVVPGQVEVALGGELDERGRVARAIAEVALVALLDGLVDRGARGDGLARVRVNAGEARVELNVTRAGVGDGHREGIGGGEHRGGGASKSSKTDH
ncbi:hypothetical protein ON010_g12666 [Phytophthora cinnamomi]|nr:hypothetical protein ON010_g12666 [Phytophthora cinnamomi]